VPAPVDLLPEHALSLAHAAPGPRPGGQRRGPGPPRRLRQPRRVVPHPRLYAARQRDHHWPGGKAGTTCDGAICRGARGEGEEEEEGKCQLSRTRICRGISAAKYRSRKTTRLSLLRVF
jgi:hypothetical protein